MIRDETQQGHCCCLAIVAWLLLFVGSGFAPDHYSGKALTSKYLLHSSPSLLPLINSKLKSHIAKGIFSLYRDIDENFTSLSSGFHSKVGSGSRVNFWSDP
ncbi:hypothetical protein ACFE04_000577 [Oxalis oulophora]